MLKKHIVNRTSTVLTRNGIMLYENITATHKTVMEVVIPLIVYPNFQPFPIFSSIIPQIRIDEIHKGREGGGGEGEREGVSERWRWEDGKSSEEEE